MTEHRGDPMARNSDPETSHRAAASVRARDGFGSQQTRLEAALRDAYPERLTNYEAAERAGLISDQGVRSGITPWRRVTDLTERGAAERFNETRYVPATGEDQTLVAWVPPDQRLSEAELARRRAPKLPKATRESLTAVARTRDRLEAFADAVGDRRALADFARDLADDLSDALTRVPGFHDREDTP